MVCALLEAAWLRIPVCVCDSGLWSVVTSCVCAKESTESYYQSKTLYVVTQYTWQYQFSEQNAAYVNGTLLHLEC
jgi:hypothetical protein